MHSQKESFLHEVLKVMKCVGIQSQALEGLYGFYLILILLFEIKKKHLKRVAAKCKQ